MDFFCKRKKICLKNVVRNILQIIFGPIARVIIVATPPLHDCLCDHRHYPSLWTTHVITVTTYVNPSALTLVYTASAHVSSTRLWSLSSRDTRNRPFGTYACCTTEHNPSASSRLPAWSQLLPAHAASNRSGFPLDVTKQGSKKYAVARV